MQRRLIPLYVVAGLVVCFLLMLIYIFIIRPSIAGVRDAGIAIELTNDANILTATAMAQQATRTVQPDPLVHGAVVIEEGKCCLYLSAGETVTLTARFDAASEVGTVTDMRVAARSLPCDSDEVVYLTEVTWEPFVAEKTYRGAVEAGWTIFSIRVQFRDVQGNLSDVLCAEIGINGASSVPTSLRP